MFGIGDKVKRTNGMHSSGMKPGDIGTVIAIKNIEDKKYVKLKEYSNGWHSVSMLIRHIDMFKSVESSFKEIEKSLDNIDWTKLANNLHKAIVSEEKRRETSELDKLKQQRDELDKKIKDIEENQVIELPVTMINSIHKNLHKDNMMSCQMFRKGRTITCILANGITNKTLAKGVAVAMPSDRFDLRIGAKLAYARALENYWKRKSHEIIRDTY